MELVVHPTAEETTGAVARRITDEMAAASGRFTLGLAGGSTPEATYRSLRGHPAAWSNVDAWLSDERWVPPDHERSNGRMAAEALLDHVEARFLRPPWSEQIDAASAADEYESAVRTIHPTGEPDLILLGMGEDGHTASLFPGTAALEEERRWIVANEVPALGETRITATYPLLWSARLLIVLVVGAGKAQAVADSLAQRTPAGRLGEGDARVEWHVDTEAAALVS